MLFFPCLLTILVSAFAVASRLQRLSHGFPEAVFFASFGLIFGIAPLMQSSESYVTEFLPESRIYAAWYAFAGLLAILAGFTVVRRPEKTIMCDRQELLRLIQTPSVQTRLKILFVVSILITAGAQLLMMRVKGIGIADLLHYGRFAHRFNNQGALSVLATHLTSFVYVPVFIGVFLNRRFQLLTALYVPAASLIFYVIFAKGTRSIPLALMATALVAASIRYRFSVRSVLLTVVAGGSCLMLAIGLFELRQHQDSLTFFGAVRTLCNASTYSGMWDRDPLGYCSNLVGAVETFPEGHPYLDGATYRRMLVFFLPESRFPELKPPDTNILFGLVVHGRPEELQVTVPPSILGDVYINFWGWKGLPVLCLHGALYCLLFQRIQSSLWAFLSLGPLIGRFLVLVHRGEPYEMFALFVVFIVLMQPVQRFCGLLGPIRYNASKARRESPRHLPQPRVLGHRSGQREQQQPYSI